ncbi:hypothetical protein [Microbulbifer taiwanensis]|uniref:hypothetical protein n=1 Tax=Microbulbifer taiwanensis TaxID=986746 RepID=UPI00360995B8
MVFFLGTFFQKDSEYRHSGEGRNPLPDRSLWIPAFAGMTDWVYLEFLDKFARCRAAANS